MTNSRTEARMAAIKALYAHELAGSNIDKSPSEVALDILDYYSDPDEEDGVSKGFDRRFFYTLLDGVIHNQDSLNDFISQHLTNNWRLERLGCVMHAILGAAAYEVTMMKETPFKVIINEYVYLSSCFFDEKDVNFVNAFLDGLTSHVRNEEHTLLNPKEKPSNPASSTPQSLNDEPLSNSSSEESVLQKKPSNGAFSTTLSLKKPAPKAPDPALEEATAPSSEEITSESDSKDVASEDQDLSPNDTAQNDSKKTPPQTTPDDETSSDNPSNS